MAYLDIKDGNGDLKKLSVTLTGSSGDEYQPNHIIQEISGANIQTIISKLSAISSSVASGGSVQTVTSSQANPVWVTGSMNVDVVVGDLINVTGSVIATPNYSTTTFKNKFVTADNTIDWGVGGGTFTIATASLARKTLTIFNPGPADLYVSLGGGVDNGFSLNTTTTPPTMYSFIVYASGTYFAESSVVSIAHGGYFPSSSLAPSFIVLSTATT